MAKAIASVDRMADALRRYPDIAEEERTALVQFLKNGSPDDINRTIWGSGLEARVSAFKKDHRSDFATGLRQWLPLLLFALAALAVMIGMRAWMG